MTKDPAGQLVGGQFDRARADVRHSQLHEVLSQAPAIICVTRGPRHIVETANAGYRRFAGNRELIGKPLREALPEADRSQLAIMDRVYKTGEPYNGLEMPPLVDSGGDERFNIVYQPLRDRTGRVYGLMTHAVEVTDQVAAHRALEERTRELARVAAALERSNRELDAFAYAASHDLRAPLRGIANLAQWIQEDLQGTLKDETRDMLQLMQSRMHRMEALIEGILQYSRAGRSPAAPETVHVGDLLDEVIDLLAPPAGASIVVPAHLPTLVTERLPLQQVFMNLVGNAVKYAGGAEASVRIGARDAEDFYEFSVSDNGPGIPEEYRERIWGIFQTLESRERVEAAGVGLALVKKLVEAQGGRVWVESNRSGGSTFRFLWPKQP